MDLNHLLPRGPFERLGGLIWLPRLIDKARARLAGKLGEYRFNCPIDQRLFAFLSITPERFLEIVGRSPDDATVLVGLSDLEATRDPEGIAAFNDRLAMFGTETGEARVRFEAAMERLAPGRDDITGWLQLLDIEEGRAR